MKLRIKYMVCFIDELNVKTTAGIDSYAASILFEPCSYNLDTDREFDTKLEAIEYLQKVGIIDHNYIILETIEPYEDANEQTDIHKQAGKIVRDSMPQVVKDVIDGKRSR